ncbi:hypothetical protein LR48_Vigan10g110400 [Vigna angularis]|uniref:Uncharacterized protein n=1 Tax=Phaseolus angularis TaxID=3914 RepID=A0A0L9VJX0_PHAAN|nr:hypothetical protein LR48_Vigan10g110400 [Vigna angularis]
MGDSGTKLGGRSSVWSSGTLLGRTIPYAVVRSSLGGRSIMRSPGLSLGRRSLMRTAFPLARGNKWRLCPLSLFLGRRAESGRGRRVVTAAILLARFLLIFWGRRLDLLGGDPESPVSGNDRIFHGVPLFLIKGGVRVVGSPFEPDELMTTPGPRKSNFLTIRKKSGASSSTARPTSVPKVPRPPPVGASTGRVPPTNKVGGSGVKVSGSGLPPEIAAVQVGPTSGVAKTSADPTRKRKDPAAEGRKDKEGSSSRSASKKARKDKGKEKDRERVLAVPLPGGVFSPEFSMSDRARFHMSSSQRALIEPLSELELTNAMLEMSTRTSALAWYLRNFADRPGVAEVRAELDREKKNAASLQLTLEQMVLNQDEYDKKIEQLEAALEKAKKEAAEGLTAARGERERMAEEGRQLKAEVARLKEAEAERVKANEELTLEVAKAKEQIVELESTILFEHEEGFNKALRQVTLLAGVQDPFSLGVDIEKDVFDGVLVDLNAAEENEPPVEAAAGGDN